MEIIRYERAEAYCDGDTLKLVEKKGFVLLEYNSEDEGGEWVDGTSWMPSLIPLRTDLLRGDFRALYLGWLASFESRDWHDVNALGADGDLYEPPVPPGLAKLSAPLKDLAEFLRVDDALLKAAAAVDHGEAMAEPSRDELARWLKRIPAASKEAYLLRFLAAEGDELIRAELFQRYREATKPKEQEHGHRRAANSRPATRCPRRSGREAKAQDGQVVVRESE